MGTIYTQSLVEKLNQQIRTHFKHIYPILDTYKNTFTGVSHKSVQIRKDPLCYSQEEKSVDNAIIQRFADILEGELANKLQLLADSEDDPMNEMLSDEILSDVDTSNHYDALIDENNDPVHDPAPLKAYMDKWDGEAFIETLLLSPTKSV